MRKISLTSPSFEERQLIPARHSCEGQDSSPPLHFENVPTETKSLAVIVEDHDAPVGVFDHWVLWNIPADTVDLPERTNLGTNGINHFGEYRYRGPCPPRGKPHRYVFKVFALGKEIDLPQGSNKQELEFAMKNHIVGYGELTGMYRR